MDGWASKYRWDMDQRGQMCRGLIGQGLMRAKKLHICWKYLDHNGYMWTRYSSIYGNWLDLNTINKGPFGSNCIHEDALWCSHHDVLCLSAFNNVFRHHLFYPTFVSFYVLLQFTNLFFQRTKFPQQDMSPSPTLYLMKLSTHHIFLLGPPYFKSSLSHQSIYFFQSLSNFSLFCNSWSFHIPSIFSSTKQVMSTLPSTFLWI